MLGRLVSDTWLEDPSRPVFIDRNGTTFELVLDYLRYGSITLPITVSRDMFFRDMDFYGIVLGEGTVKTCTEAWSVKEGANRLEEMMTRLKMERGALEGRIERLIMAELKGVEQLKTDLKGDIEQLKTDLKEDIQQLKRLIKHLDCY
jgi:hypothetical protein